MPVRSKWQSLPTEAINPATLAIDKQSAADIVEGMLNEDRKMLAAVQREKERIAVGVDIITQALRKNGRIIFVGAGTSGRLGIVATGAWSRSTLFERTDPTQVESSLASGFGHLVFTASPRDELRFVAMLPQHLARFVDRARARVFE